MKKLFIITGEYSGDLHAANVVCMLQKNMPELQIEAIGGINLKKTGIKLFSDHSKMSAGGLSLKIIIDHYMLGRKVVNYLKNEYKPDMVLFVDYGGFNLNLSKVLKKELPSTKLYYYIPPQIWASRQWRINTVKNNIDKVLTIFPFENKMYEDKGINVEFVGHPIINEIKPPVDKDLFFDKHGFDRNKKLVAIFPGSRKLEITNLMPIFLKTVQIIQEKYPNVQFALAQAANIKDEQLSVYKPDDSIKILKNSNYELLSASDVLMLASGTVALEAALYNTPMSVCYKVPELFYQVYLKVRSIDRVSLPNIIAQKDIFEELIQYKCKPEIIANNILELLQNEEKYKNMKQDLSKVKALLSTKDSAITVANIIAEDINK